MLKVEVSCCADRHKPVESGVHFGLAAHSTGIVTQYSSCARLVSCTAMCKSMGPSDMCTGAKGSSPAAVCS